MGASVVIIKERTGRQRVVELVGGALPLQGANWDGAQLLVTNWNPGNREATQHVLGPQELPSSWDFSLHTTVINRTPIHVTDNKRRTNFNLVRADSLARLFEDIFRGGSLLEVNWISSASDSAGLPSVRVSRLGRAGTWNFNYDRPDDITGSVVFDWVGRGGRQPKVSDLRGEDLLAVSRQAIIRANAASDAVARDVLQSSDRNQPLSATTFTLGDLEAIANGPRDLVDSFARSAQSIANRTQRLGNIINTVKETPAAIAGRAVDIANNAVAVANQFVDQLSREGPETQSLRGKVSNLTRNATYFSTVVNEAGFMTDVYERMAESARQRQSSIFASAGSSRRQDRTRVEDAFQVHVPRAGDTMISISLKYYGTPDLGDEIAVANGLPAMTVEPPKQPIIIPTRRTLETQTRNRV